LERTEESKAEFEADMDGIGEDLAEFEEMIFEQGDMGAFGH